MSASSVQALAERKNRQVSKRPKTRYQIKESTRLNTGISKCWHPGNVIEQKPRACWAWRGAGRFAERPVASPPQLHCRLPLAHPPALPPRLCFSLCFMGPVLTPLVLTTRPFILHLLGTASVPGSVQGCNCLVTCLFLCWTPGSLIVRRDCVLVLFFGGGGGGVNF